VAVASPVGVDSSSAVTISILRPSITPAALIASNAALAPIALLKKVDDAFPVTDVMKPILMVSFATPGALAVFPEVPSEPDVGGVPPELDVGAAPPDAVVGVELFELLPHPAASSAIAATTTLTTLRLSLTTFSLGTRPSPVDVPETCAHIMPYELEARQASRSVFRANSACYGAGGQACSVCRRSAERVKRRDISLPVQRAPVFVPPRTVRAETCAPRQS
jgi:hypothetical protein